MSQQTERKETPEVLAERLLGAGLEDEAICRRVRETCRLATADAEKCLAAARRTLAAVARQSDAEHQQRSRLVYAAVKRDEAANPSQKMRAQQHLDELLGLPGRLAQMHAGGEDDPDVIEALAFYRSVLQSPQSNVAQRLRAQGGLDRLRREVNKKTVAPAPAPRRETASAAEPPTAPAAACTAPSPSKPAPATSCPIREKPGKSLPIGMPIRAKERPQRNAPCPCGSGKKYKSCCRPAHLRSALLE